MLYFLGILALLQYMKKREAFSHLRPIMAVYNVICICLASYCVYGTIHYSITRSVRFVCNEVDFNDPAVKPMLLVHYVFYIQKYFEFIDTFFFILRKNYRQLTFLHIYHHSSITFITLTFSTYELFGDTSLAMFLNSFIHVLMYTHYLLTSMGIKGRWAKYLTGLQILQFVIIAVQAVLGYLQGCGTPIWINIGITLYMITMICLFGSFYIKKYLFPAASKVEELKKIE